MRGNGFEDQLTFSNRTIKELLNVHKFLPEQIGVSTIAKNWNTWESPEQGHYAIW